MTKQSSPFDHTGSSFDSFLQEEGILGEVEAAAIRALARMVAGVTLENRYDEVSLGAETGREIVEW
jgi:hypothetical protein